MAVWDDLSVLPTDALWYERGMAHLRDYVDFGRSWWDEFVSGVGRACLKVSDAVERTVAKTYEWLKRQAAPSLELIFRALGPDALNDLLVDGRGRLSGWQSHVLQCSAVA
jgi:hypothetical protein